jgi:hypothetical protein
MKKDRTGETNIASNGQKITIIAYNGADDINIQFEDGTIVTNKTYQSFKTGSVRNPNKKNLKDYKIGETNIANNGQVMTIIDYRGADDIDIQFEDGTIVTNRTYKSFKNRCIRNHNIQKNKDKIKKDKSKRNDRIGETNIMNNGQLATIIDYRNNNDIDVQFEDCTIVYNKNYRCFQIGKIKNPNKKVGINIGDSKISNNGMKMTIIAYRGYTDIDVQFEDGTVVNSITSSQWSNGNIKYPINKRIGETVIAKNGQKMILIAYRKATDIDVQFEDGTIVTNKTYDCFKEGNIRNPNKIVYNKAMKKWINNSKLNINNGLKMTIIDYVSNTNISLLFETGYKVLIGLEPYKKGTVKHPFPYQIDDIIMEKLEYLHNNIGNFYCTCTKCGHRDIWNMNEIKEHKCIN